MAMNGSTAVGLCAMFALFTMAVFVVAAWWADRDSGQSRDDDEQL
jgi:hypothetical protein